MDNAVDDGWLVWVAARSSAEGAPNSNTRFLRVLFDDFDVRLDMDVEERVRSWTESPLSQTVYIRLGTILIPDITKK